MRPLSVNDEVRKEIATCVNHALMPANWFQPGDHFIPGDHPEHVVVVPEGYRCVFVFTLSEGTLYRHLQISVGHPTLFACPEAAVVIARLFGFTGGDGKDLDLKRLIEKDGWIVEADGEQHCVNVAQPMEMARA